MPPEGVDERDVMDVPVARRVQLGDDFDILGVHPHDEVVDLGKFAGAEEKISHGPVEEHRIPNQNDMGILPGSCADLLQGTLKVGPCGRGERIFALVHEAIEDGWRFRGLDDGFDKTDVVAADHEGHVVDRAGPVPLIEIVEDRNLGSVLRGIGNRAEKRRELFHRFVEVALARAPIAAHIGDTRARIRDVVPRAVGPGVVVVDGRPAVFGVLKGGHGTDRIEPVSAHDQLAGPADARAVGDPILAPVLVEAILVVVGLQAVV